MSKMNDLLPDKIWLREESARILQRYPGMNFLADTSKDLADFIHSYTQEKCREAVISELVDIKSVATTSDNMWYRHIEKRIAQLNKSKGE